MGKAITWLPILGTANHCPFTDDELEAFNQAAQHAIAYNQHCDRIIKGHRVISSNRRSTSSHRYCDLQIIKSGIGNYMKVAERSRSGYTMMFELPPPTN